MYSGATYPWVPKTRVETCPPALSGPSFANPKSETLAWNFLSKRMLLLLKSLWITGGLTCSWRYSKPLAASSAILSRVSQSNFTGVIIESTRKSTQTYNITQKNWQKIATLAADTILGHFKLTSPLLKSFTRKWEETEKKRTKVLYTHQKYGITNNYNTLSQTIPNLFSW